MECSSHYKPTLYLIRGFPGSGKTTLAKMIYNNLHNPAHYEADMYFVDDEGNYNFNPKDVPKAHEACQQWTRGALALGKDVIVSNTFTRRWELAPYMQMAEEYRATVVEIVCKGDFPNIHNVSQATIDNMKARWED